MKLPDITPAQVVAVVGAVLGVLVAFGVDISGSQREAVLGLVTILSTALVVSDAHIRNGRARNLSNLGADRKPHRR